jgi:ABC-type phosphate transport system substrate-binding protein
MHLKSLLTLFVLTPWALTCLAGESIAVVTSKTSKIDKLSLAEIRALYLGETRRLQSGKTVDIGDRDRASDLHRDFYHSVAEMSPKDVAVHWAKKVFTGKATAPARVAGDDEAAKAWVKAKPDAITYIAAKSVDGQVKVVGTLGP